MRLTELYQDIRRTRDWPLVFLLTLGGLIGLWLAALPWNSVVQRTTLRRLQMETPHFIWWAIQQPIPAMYNCENRVAVLNRSPTSAEVTAAIATGRTLNHFPYRVFSFGDGRFDYLRDDEAKWLCAQSLYQDQMVQTVWRAEPVFGGGRRVVRQQTSEQ